MRGHCGVGKEGECVATVGKHNFVTIVLCACLFGCLGLVTRARLINSNPICDGLRGHCGESWPRQCLVRWEGFKLFERIRHVDRESRLGISRTYGRHTYPALPSLRREADQRGRWEGVFLFSIPLRLYKFPQPQQQLHHHQVHK